MTLSHGLSGDIKEIADKFFEYCGRNGDNSLMYTIEVDLPDEQVYHVHTRRNNKIEELYQKMQDFIEDRRIKMFKEKMRDGVVSFKFSVEPIEEITESIYLRRLGIDSDNKVGVTKMKVLDLWTTHLAHPYFNDILDEDITDLLIRLNENKMIKPILLDDSVRTSQYPFGIIQDGYKRLRAHKTLGIEEINVVRKSDLISEDQYKFATTKHARDQAPRSGSSIEPAQTFGGVPTQPRGKKIRKSIDQKIDESIASMLPPDILGVFVQGIEGMEPEVGEVEVIQAEPVGIAGKLQDLLGAQPVDMGSDSNSIELSDILNHLRAIEITACIQSRLYGEDGIQYLENSDKLAGVISSLGQTPCHDLSDISNKAGYSISYSGSGPGLASDAAFKQNELMAYRLDEYNKALDRVKTINQSAASVLLQIMQGGSCNLHALE